MDYFEKLRRESLARIDYIRNSCPDRIFPADLISLSTADLKALYDYHITEINEENEIMDLKSSYLSFVCILQFIYFVVINGGLKYDSDFKELNSNIGEIKQELEKDLDKMSKYEIRDRIWILFQNLKTDLAECKNLSSLDDKKLLNFCHIIKQTDNVDTILKLLKRYNIYDTFTF